MKVLLIDNGSILLEKLKTLIPGEESIIKFDSLKSVNTDNFDLVILSGSHDNSIVWNGDKYLDELNFVKNTTKPIIGICFGLELIVKSFGGEIKELENKDKGIKEIEILDKSIYSKPVIKVYESHRWTVGKLPEDFDILAKSEIGPEIIKHKTLPIYGFQFHPENFVDELEGDEVFLQLFSNLSNY